MRQSSAPNNDAYAVSDGLGVVASAQTGAPLPTDPEALIWLIQHVRDVWMMRMAAAQQPSDQR
jgi:hypothetical protein